MIKYIYNHFREVIGSKSKGLNRKSKIILLLYRRSYKKLYKKIKVINILSCEILTVRLEDDIQLKIKNWLLLNKEKKIKLIQHTYIPPVIIPISENDPIKKDPGMEKATYTERRGYHLVSFYYETQTP